MSTTDQTQEMLDVTIGKRNIKILKGGIYDTYHMDTDLDKIAQDPRVTSVDFFRALPKKEVSSPIGNTLTPNYYYRMSSARLVMLAPASALKKRLPKGLDPLTIVPGIGIVSVMFFRYDVCDIDGYGETAAAIAVCPPRHGGMRTVDFVTGLKNDDLYVHVLSLPVTSELAWVRGHDGYGFPKWVTGVDLDINSSMTHADVLNDAGEKDIELSVATPKLKTFRSGDHVTTLHSITTVDGSWNETLSQSNVMSLGTAMMPKDVKLTLGKGRISDDLRSLKVGKIIQLEVSDNSQLALHMPQPISVKG